MLKTIDLIKDVDEKYVPMLEQVNIPDFTKCIATYARQSMSEIHDDVIKRYLVKWAENKYRFFKMLGDKTQLDAPLVYKRLKEEMRERMINLAQEFPAYYPWLEACRFMTENKITTREVGWEFGRWVSDAFPDFRYEGSSLTRFFKSCLQAPDTLINRIAAAFENNTVEATYTISIDPVDMMLASENPYDWGSCYRLDPCDEENHADGCLAAILDTSSLITYVWNKEGEYKLKERDLKFKSIRYKKMRAWISISPDFNAFYMNKVYPGKNEYSDDFEKALRIIIEKAISDYTQLEDKWISEYYSKCRRLFPYGYNEADYHDRTFVRLGYENSVVNWDMYDVRIICPCGCGQEMPGFCDEQAVYCDHREYNGEGFTCEGIRDQYYCEYSDDYCDCDPECSDSCLDCVYYQDAHPTCSLDRSFECPNYDYYGRNELEIERDYDGSFVRACDGCSACMGCSVWKEECGNEEEEE